MEEPTLLSESDFQVSSPEPTEVPEVPEKRMVRCSVCKISLIKGEYLKHFRANHSQRRKIKLEKWKTNKKKKMELMKSRKPVVKYEHDPDYIAHLGAAQKFLPKHLHVKSHSLKPQSVRACSLCQKKFQHRGGLYNHLSDFHFKHQLELLIDNDLRRCPYCDKTFPNGPKRNLLRHIGSVHRMVDELLARELHIPKKVDHQKDAIEDDLPVDDLIKEDSGEIEELIGSAEENGDQDEGMLAGGGEDSKPKTQNNQARSPPRDDEEQEVKEDPPPLSPEAIRHIRSIFDDSDDSD